MAITLVACVLSSRFVLGPQFLLMSLFFLSAHDEHDQGNLNLVGIGHTPLSHPRGREQRCPS